MADSRTPPSLLSTAGALQARIPPPANVTRNKTAIESRDRLMIVLDVKPPAFDGREFAVARTFCGRDPSSRAVLTAIERRLMMPGIDPPGKRFSAALRVSDRGLTPRRCREMPVALASVDVCRGTRDTFSHVQRSRARPFSKSAQCWHS